MSRDRYIAADKVEITLSIRLGSLGVRSMKRFGAVGRLTSIEDIARLNSENSLPT